MKKRTNKSLNKLAQNLSPSVFEEAAEKLFYGTGGYCCVVIKFEVLPHSSNSVTKGYIDFFASFFKPKRSAYDGGWWRKPSIGVDQYARVLALLLAANILQDLKESQSQ